MLIIVDIIHLMNLKILPLFSLDGRLKDNFYCFICELLSASNFTTIGINISIMSNTQIKY